MVNPQSGKKERIGRILRMHANKREEVSEAYTGDILAAVGLKNVTTGDTLSDITNPILLERMVFPVPVIHIAVEPRTKADQEQLDLSLSKLAEEDPTFQIKTDEETGQTILSGMGELHLEILIDRLKREFKVDANVGRPQVAYRESITREVTNRHKFVKQSGGRGQYGDVEVIVGPAEKGKNLVFEDNTKGGAIPKEYINSCRKGREDAMSSGAIAGFPIEDLHVQLVDGSYHEVDSSEMAFRICTSMAVQEAIRKAGPILLEPLMAVEVVMPQQYTGEIVGDLNMRRGRIENINARHDAQVVDARVPLSEMFGYATQLRSLSQDALFILWKFDSYQQVPESIAKEVIAKFGGTYRSGS